MGRPRKFRLNDQQLEEFLGFLRMGQMRGAAADDLARLHPTATITRRAVREYVLENPKVEAAVLDAEVDATENVQEALYQAAISGNVAAAKAWIQLKTGAVISDGNAKPKPEAKPTSGAVAPLSEDDGPPPAVNDDEDSFDALGLDSNVSFLDPRQRRRAMEGDNA